MQSLEEFLTMREALDSNATDLVWSIDSFPINGFNFLDIKIWVFGQVEDDVRSTSSVVVMFFLGLGLV